MDQQLCRRQAACFISIVLTLVGVKPTLAQEDGVSVLLRPLPLPVGVSELTTHAQASGAELFLASDRQLFIRSPFGDENGWEPVVELQVDDDDRIVSLACCLAPDGEALLVATESNLFAVRWKYRENATQPWGRFRYRFEVRRIPNNESWGPHSRLYSFSRESSSDADQHAVQGWLATSSAEIVPVLNRVGQLQFGNPVDLRAGGVVPMWTAGSAGWSYAWPYASATLWTLGPDGEAVGEPVDFRDLMAPDPTVRDRVEIECVWLDESRDLLFVGTSHGLAVAEVEDQSGRMRSDFVRVEAAKLATIKLIGSTAGRMWVVTESADSIEGLDGPLLMEATVGRRCLTRDECAQMTLFRPVEHGNGPENVSQAVQIDDDRVLAEGGDNRLWYWTPGFWGLVPGSDTALRDLSIWQTSAPGQFPLVVSDLLGIGLWYTAPDSPIGWHTHPLSRQQQVPTALVPDPSGKGVWTVSDGSSAAVQFGWLTFQSPHGLLHGDLGVTGGPRRVRVRSLSVQLASGQQRWPVSGHGGLLLPSGENLVYAESGFQQPLEWPLPDGVSLEHMLPGGESSDTAWLAVRKEAGQPNRVVRVDLAEDTNAGQTPKLDIRPTSVQCAEELSSVLVPDSQGSVWFAVGAPTDSLDTLHWIGHRIRLIVDEADRTRDFGNIPSGETPQLLWLAPDEGLLARDHTLFTERGVARIPRIELPFGQPGGLRLLTPEQRPAGPWGRLFPNEDTRQVRTALRSHCLPPFDTPTAGTLLLTRSVPASIDGQRGPFPDLAFEFNVESPATTLQPVTGRQRDTATPRPVVMWSPGESDVPEFVVWGEANGNAPSRSIIELLEREDASTLNSHRLNIPILGIITHGVRVPANVDSDVPTVDFALTDGSLIAMHRQTPQDYWGRWWLPAFPTEITVRDSVAGDQTFRVAESTLPSTLPHTAQEVAVRISPSYTHWWVSDLSGARLAPNEDISGARFSRDGRAELALHPGTEYAFSVTHHDPLTGEKWPLANLPVSVDVAPPPPRSASPVLYIALTLAGLVSLSGGAIALKAAWRRGFAAWILRRYWSVVVADCHLEAELIDDGRNRMLGIRTPRDERFRESFSHFNSSEWQLPESVKTGLLTESCGRSSVATVLVEGDADVLKQMSLRSADVVDGSPDRPRIITGFVPFYYHVPGRPEPTHRLVVVRMREGVPAEFGDDAVVERIRRSGFEYFTPEEGQPRREQFVNVLATAHVVLVTGGPTFPGFQDAKEFVAAVRGRNLRCRLVVFLTRDESRPTDLPATFDSEEDERVKEQELLLSIAAAGIHVVSVGRLATDEAERAFSLGLLDSLLPETGRKGQSLAQGLSDAVSAAETVDPDIGRRAADSLRLFGDPSARVDGIRTYDGFLSHSHIDRRAVQWLQGYLCKRWLLWMRRRHLCRDEADFGAIELSREVPARLSGSKYLIVCCSQDSAQSHWVKREIRCFLRDHASERLLLCDIGEATEPVVDSPEFVAWIEQRSGRRDLLRPNLRGAPGRTPEVRSRVRSESMSLLAPLMGTDKNVLIRQRTRMWIGLIVIAAVALVSSAAYAWWKQTPDGLRYALVQSAINDAETGSEVNDPGLIPMGAAFGRMNDRSTLKRFAQHFNSEDWRALYLANGYLSLPQPDCESASSELRKVSDVGLLNSPRPALLASRVCGQVGWFHSAEPGDPADRGSNWIKALIDTGFLDEAEELIRDGEFSEDELIDLRLRAGVARGPEFRFSDGFLAQVANHDSANSVMYDVLFHLRELDWRDRLGDSSATQLLELAVQQFKASQTQGVLPQRWQQLAAHLIKVNRRDVALNLLQNEPPQEHDLSDAETWAWRGLAMQRLGRRDEAARCFANAETCADLPVEMSRTWAEWFEIARVYALAGEWKSAFLAAGKPGTVLARFQLKCFVLVLGSGGPMDSSVLGVYPTN